MRQAFVLQLGSQTDVSRHQFEGCIEEVDTGRELRFKSTEEMLDFLGKCFVENQQCGRGVKDRCGDKTKQGG